MPDMRSHSQAERSPRHILFLCADVFPPPSAGRFLDHIYNRILFSQGYRTTWVMPSAQVDTLTLSRWGANPAWLIPKIRPADPASLVRDYYSHLRWIDSAVLRLIRTDARPELVHVRDDPVMAYVALKVSRRLGVPFVYQLSHLKEEESIYYARTGLRAGRVSHLLKGGFGLLVRNPLLRRADIVCPISRQMKKKLTRYGIRPNKMFVLPTGADAQIDPHQFDNRAGLIRSRYNLEDRKVIIYVGTLHRLRQLDFMLRTLRLVKNTIPDAHLLLVGDSPDHTDVTWLKDVARELGVDDCVTFTGQVSAAEVPAYIRAADVGVSPIPPNPIYLNSSPIKPLEYLALEIPCVASDIPSQRELLASGAGGVCVPFDETAFAEAVCRLLTLPVQARRELGRAGRSLVKRLRDFHVLAERIVQIYEKAGISRT